MNKRRTKLLIPSLSGRWARVGLTALLTAVAFGTQAQTNDEGATQPPRDQNSELRTRTWSFYTQGGLSWATDVWYQNLDAKKSYKQSTAVGGGVDYTIRPWVRVGAEYLWSSYRREQRFSALDTKKSMPVKVYGNYLMNYHNAKLGVGFNIMELWSHRRTQWLNIWVGTGVGYTFAKGNEYGMYISNTKTEGGTTTPFVDGSTISNESSITITGNVRTTNRHEKFDTFYLPTSLHIEADVSRQFTIGLKGEMDWLFNRKDIAPKNLIFALATVRYNFVPSRTKVQRAYYEGEISTLNDRMNTLRQVAEAEKARADREIMDKARLQQQNADLERRLQDCEAAKSAVTATLSHFVQFDHDSSYMSGIEEERLRAFAQSVKGHKLALIAEASTPGADGYNQQLSERRLTRVVEALVKEGFALDNLHPTTAIGEQQGKPAAEGRRVTITVLQ